LLDKILSQLPDAHPDTALLAGRSNAEDASVYRLTDDLAVVNTVDIFTPVVDDPYDYGRIAAANSLSDVYAMGAKPVLALNVLAFHQGKIPAEVVTEILRGAQDKTSEAGCVIAGGPSIQDTEIKYGLSVTGIVHPKTFWRNHTPKTGDVMVLTKPLGTGCITTALKHEKADAGDSAAAIAYMAELNRLPVEILIENQLHVHACTDITGYGLAGHLVEMLHACGCSAQIKLGDIPLLPNVLNHLGDPACLPGGFYNNMLYNQEQVLLPENLEEARRNILYDPQTSGGLLIALSPEEADQLLEALKKRRYPLEAAVIGSILPGQSKKIVVVE